MTYETELSSEVLCDFSGSMAANEVFFRLTPIRLLRILSRRPSYRRTADPARRSW